MSLIIGLHSLHATPQEATSKKEETPTLNTVVVKDKSDPSLTIPSSTTAAQQLNRVAGGTNLILGEDLKKGRVNTWQDVFQNTAGVYAVPRFGAEEARISIRGSGVQRTFHGRGITVLQDGIPVNLTDGSFDMQSIEPLAADYISVWRGANALRYGSSTLGGAINFVSKTGHSADLFQARAEYGSFDTVRGQISSGEVVGPFDYYLSVSHASQDGFREHAQQNSQKLVGNMGWKINDYWENRFYLTHVNSRSELPGSLSKGQLYSNPMAANATSTRNHQKRDFELVRLADQITWRDQNQRFDGSVYWSWKDLDHPISSVVDQETNDVGIRLAYENTGELFERKNRFTVGTNQGLGVTNANQFTGPTGSTIVSRTIKTADATQTATQHDLFFENEHYLTDRFAVLFGSQFVVATRDVEAHPPDGAQPSSSAFSAINRRSASEAYTSWNPKIGFLYDFTSDVVGFINYSRSSEPPTFSELGTTATSGVRLVDQQIADTIEIGTRGKADRFQWDLAYYYAWLQDEYLSLNDGNGNSLGTINSTASYHQGVELSLQTKIWEGLWDAGVKNDSEKDSVSIRQTYLWNDFGFASDPVYGKNQFGGFPEHVYRAELTYEHPCGFYIGPNVDWIPVKAPVDHANRLFNEAYFLTGARVGYKSQKGFSVYFEAKNLFDEKYASTTGVVADTRLGSIGANTASFNPGDGRAFYGGVEFKY